LVRKWKEHDGANDGYNDYLLHSAAFNNLEEVVSHTEDGKCSQLEHVKTEIDELRYFWSRV
jgi:hypothetical protein